MALALKQHLHVSLKSISILRPLNLEKMAKCQTLIALCHVKITNQFHIILFFMKKPALLAGFCFLLFSNIDKNHAIAATSHS